MKNKSIAKRSIHFLVNSFIIFHLLAFITWSSPIESEWRNRFVTLITPYMLWSGLWQGWDMFAPDPLRLNSHLEALVTFQNGAQVTWEFPRMDKLSYVDRYRKERYRKWSLSYVRLDAYSSIWPDTARFVARKFYNAANPPVVITLKRLWMEIPPPRANSIHQELPKEYYHRDSYTFYVYQIRQGDFA